MATQSIKLGPGKVRVHVAAFGKHPGWDDHIEEIGLDSDELVRVKRLMYTEGMAGNIDAGAWEKLDESNRLAAFGHVFYWKDRESLIIGRLWSSSDGKGRTKYPMVVAAQVEGVPQWWAVEQILPRLEAAEARCTGGKTADAVRAAIGECRRGLEDAAALLTVSPTGGSGDSALLRSLVSSPALDAEGQPRLGLIRVMYEIDREMAPYRSGVSRTRTSSVSISPAHVRVPRCLSGPGEGARAWLALLRQELSPGAPVVIIEPLGAEWLDVVVGVPNPTSLFCVRASETGLALTSRVPYTIPSGFATDCASKVQAWASGVAAEPRPSAPKPEESSGPTGGSFSRWLMPAGGVLLLSLGVAILSIARCGGPSPGGQNAAQPPATLNEPPPNESKQAVVAPAPEPAKPPPAVTPKATPAPPDAVPSKPVETPPGVATPAPSADPAPAGVKPAPVTNVADPRAAWTFRADVQRATDAIQAIDAALVAEGAPPDATLRERLEAIVERAGLVRAMPWNDANSDAVRRAVEGVNADLLAVEKDAAASLLAARERTRTALAAMPSPVTSDPFAKVWTEAVAAADVAAGAAQASKQLTALGAVLARTEAAFSPDPLADPPPMNAAIDAGAIAASAADRRGAAMAEAARLAGAGDAERAERLAADYNRWATETLAVGRQASALADALARGAGLGDPVGDGGPTVGESAERVTASPSMKDAGAALGQVLSRVEELRTLAASDDPGVLTRAVTDASADSSALSVSAVMTAWDRLGEIAWPTDDPGLSRAAEMAAGPVANAVARTPAAARGPVAARAAAASGRMWRNYLTARGGTDDGLTRALAARTAMGVSQAQVDSLPSWVRYNIALREFLTKARAPAAGADSPVRTAAQAFLKDVAPLAADVPAPAAAMIAAVKAQAEKPPAANVTTLGPGSVGWACAPGPGDSAVFTWSKGGTDHALTFLPVRTESGATAFVCTTELSIGLLIDVLAESRRWDDARKLMANLPEDGKDGRKGVRAWTWTPGRSAVMVVSAATPTDPSMGWSPGVSGLGDNSFYAVDLSARPAPPARETPAQYLSPAAAMFAARMLGCRLPTAAEWRAAVGDQPGPANLRDATWKKQFNHANSLKQKGVLIPFPGADAFWPLGSKRPSLAATDDGDAATDADDGWLWFAPGDPRATRFLHLVGNVAEFVTEADVPADQLPAATEEAVGAWVGGAERLRVIGGSALSAREIDPREPQKVNRAQLKGGCADVGLRPAFSAPQGGGAGTAEVWKDLIGRASLLQPPE